MIFENTQVLLEHPLADDVWRKMIKDFNAPISYINHELTTLTLINANKCGLDQGTEKLLKWAITLCTMEPAKIQAFMGLTRDVMDNMVQQVLDSKGYQEGFNNVNLQEEFPLEQMNIPNGDIYSKPNIGKTYISLDLTEAAFSAFKTWDAHSNLKNEILEPQYTTYRDWVSHTVTIKLKPEDDVKRRMMTSMVIRDILTDYVCDSKQIRQVIFGKTNPKRIQHIEKWLTQNLAKYIHEGVGQMPVRFNNDEIIYEYTPELEKFLANDLGINQAVENDAWHVTKFYLEAWKMQQFVILKNKASLFSGPTVFVKVRDGKEPSFKCLPSRFALGFEHLYKSYRGAIPETGKEVRDEDFLNIPVLTDGYLNWIMSSPCNTIWQIEEVKNQEVNE